MIGRVKYILVARQKQKSRYSYYLYPKTEACRNHWWSLCGSRLILRLLRPRSLLPLSWQRYNLKIYLLDYSPSSSGNKGKDSVCTRMRFESSRQSFSDFQKKDRAVSYHANFPTSASFSILTSKSTVISPHFVPCLHGVQCCPILGIPFSVTNHTSTVLISTVCTPPPYLAKDDLDLYRPAIAGHRRCLD